MTIRKFTLRKKGFTLIELMIVVAIIGILAAIAIPQFAQLVAKANEAACKGNLGAIRSALSIYYGDMEGYYPTDALQTITLQQKYLLTMPTANLPHTTLNPGHGNINTISTAAGGLTAAITDAGGWAYDNTGQTGQSTWGALVVNCSHTDLKSVKWTSY